MCVECTMGNFKLEPGDILVNVNDRNDPFSVIKRWASGPYEHVFMYMGQVGILVSRRQPRILRFPFLFESNGGGCCLRLLSERYGEEVVVMRVRWGWVKGKLPQVIEEAIKLASDDKSFYDYYCIARFILPRLLAEKLHLPLPLRYHRDPRVVCSEAVTEIFWRKDIEILSQGVVPLPSDFVEGSPLLGEGGRGKLSLEWV